MIKKLNLVEGLLSKGRRLHELGQYPQAARVLQKLVVFQLPKEIAEEAQSRLAEIQFREGRFVRARRHLRAALAHQPANADYYHRLAVALEEDPEGDPLRALNHYKRCLKLDSKNPHYWCDFGYAALNAEQQEQGLKALRKAERLAPNNPEVLALVVRGLSVEGFEDEARNLLKAALFRNPRDFRFRGLWNRFQFDLLFERQRKSQAPPKKIAVTKAKVLPFRQPRHQDMKLGTRTFRLDGPSTLKGPTAPASRRKRSSKKSD